jgi:hypothetical protein
MPLASRVGAGVLASVLAVGCTGSSPPPPSHTSPTGHRATTTRGLAWPLPPPRFKSAHGWVTLSRDPSVALDPDGWAVAFASTIPFARKDFVYRAIGVTVHAVHDGYLTDPVMPNATMRRLPPNGVLIVADFMGLARGRNVNFPGSSLPLDLQGAEVQSSWEGQVAPNIPMYLIEDTARGIQLDIRVFFGTQHPDRATRRKANTELARLLVPSVATPVPIAPPSLSSRAGWHVIQTNRSTSEGVSWVVSDRLSQAWAATVPFARFDLAHLKRHGELRFAGWPEATILHRLGRSGIAVVVTPLGFRRNEVRSEPPDPAFPPRRLPLRLSEARVLPWDGARGVRQYVIDGRTGGTYFDARVFVGTPRPGARVLRQVQQELDTPRLPPAPR